jgi:peptide/nickel transport system permease protein
MAVASLIVLIALGLVALFADRVAPYGFDEIPFTDVEAVIANPNLMQESINRSPTLDGKHLFGTDNLGRDYLSRVIFGLRTSLWVALFVALLSTAIGTALGAISGYYGGVVDNLLMRFTDLILTLPGLAVLLTAAAFLGQSDSKIGPVTLSQTIKVWLILAFLFWTALARIVRGTFLSLREKEYVEAAKASGASDARIIVRHMLPNSLGPIIVNMTLVIATAILVEAALSFLGFGIQPPKPALGSLISQGQAEGLATWWLVTFPGLVIVVIALAINFVGDGLRDALDPTQRRVRA